MEWFRRAFGGGPSAPRTDGMGTKGVARYMTRVVATHPAVDEAGYQRLKALADSQRKLGIGLAAQPVVLGQIALQQQACELAAMAERFGMERVRVAQGVVFVPPHASEYDLTTPQLAYPPEVMLAAVQDTWQVRVYGTDRFHRRGTAHMPLIPAGIQELVRRINASFSAPSNLLWRVLIEPQWEVTELSKDPALLVRLDGQKGREYYLVGVWGGDAETVRSLLTPAEQKEE